VAICHNIGVFWNINPSDQQPREAAAMFFQPRACERRFALLALVYLVNRRAESAQMLNLCQIAAGSLMGGYKTGQ